MAESSTHEIRLDPQWGGRVGIYGGKVIAALAAGAGLEGYDLLSLSVEFSGAVQAGPAELEVTRRHLGRVSASVEVVLRQGHDKARASAKLARVEGADDPWGLAPAVGMPGPYDVPPFAPSYWEELAHCRLLELRLLEHEVSGGQRTTRVWLRLVQDRPETAELDHAGQVAVLIDAVPPAHFFADSTTTFVPTLDFSLHLRPGRVLPDDGWCFAEGRLVWATEDFCLEEVTLYAASGEVLAQARQNRRIVRAG